MYIINLIIIILALIDIHIIVIIIWEFTAKMIQIENNSIKSPSLSHE